MGKEIQHTKAYRMQQKQFSEGNLYLGTYTLKSKNEPGW
jgi:hypothetical protein